MLSKTQVDKIGDRLRDGCLDEDAIHALEEYREGFLSAYSYTERMLRDVLGHTVTGRPAKTTLSIIEKLRRQRWRLTQIQDIAGCRVVVGNIGEQESLVDAAQVMFKNIEVDDKRVKPSHGYRAVHLIVRHDGKMVEVQVRTRLQHFWAEISEKMADTYGHEIKYGQGNPWALDLLDKMSKRIRSIEKLHLDRLKFERGAARSLDRSLMKTAKKKAAELDRELRLEFYGLRELVRQIES